MGKSLMIVDDSATMRKIIMRTVRMSGLEFERTEEAGSGSEALAKLQASPVDVMLCDINMPEMSGTELVKQARQLPACSRHEDHHGIDRERQELIDRVLADGADGYITKPFTPEKFQEKLTPLLN